MQVLHLVAYYSFEGPWASIETISVAVVSDFGLIDRRPRINIDCALRVARLQVNKVFG